MQYIPLYRPASFCTLPPGVTFTYIEAPHALPRCPAPRSNHRYGVIETSRPLTQEECEVFELRAV